MSYKTYYKKGEAVLVRLQVIQHRIYDNIDMKDIAFRFAMHRNTITAIMKIYEALAPPEFKKKILSGDHFSLQEI